MRTPELGVVGMVMVVGTPPNAAGAEGQDSKDSHEALGQPGAGQNRLMLLIVIDHKQPEQQETGQHTANHLAGQMEVPNSPRNGGHQQEGSG